MYLPVTTILPYNSYHKLFFLGITWCIELVFGIITMSIMFYRLFWIAFSNTKSSIYPCFAFFVYVEHLTWTMNVLQVFTLVVWSTTHINFFKQLEAAVSYSLIYCTVFLKICFVIIKVFVYESVWWQVKYSLSHQINQLCQWLVTLSFSFMLYSQLLQFILASVQEVCSVFVNLLLKITVPNTECFHDYAYDTFSFTEVNVFCN